MFPMGCCAGGFFLLVSQLGRLPPECIALAIKLGALCLEAGPLLVDFVSRRFELVVPRVIRGTPGRPFWRHGLDVDGHFRRWCEARWQPVCPRFGRLPGGAILL